MGFRIGNPFTAVGKAIASGARAVEREVTQLPRQAGSLLEGAKDAFEREGLTVGGTVGRMVENAAFDLAHHSLTPTIGTPHPHAGDGRPPVILLAGQSDKTSLAMGTFARSLERDGFRVYCFDDPGHGLESHAVASQRLDALVEKVRAETGSDKVSLVGYSTGGTNARAYADLYGGADKVDRVVQLGGSNNGDPEAFGFCESGREEKPGSAFMTALNAQPSHVPTWSIFENQTDGEVLETDARLVPGPNRHDVELPQKRHGGIMLGVISDHLEYPFDGRAYDQAVAALTAES